MRISYIMIMIDKILSNDNNKRYMLDEQHQMIIDELSNISDIYQNKLMVVDDN